jgi:hypothetical protein
MPPIRLDEDHRAPRRFYVCQAAGNGCGRGPSCFAGGRGGLGDRPASPSPPVVLAAGEACGAVADGGLSTRRARGGKFPEENSDKGAPQGNFCAAGPDEGGARRAGADTYNPSGQQPKTEKRFYSPSGARTVTQRAALCATGVRGRSPSSQGHQHFEALLFHSTHRSHSRNPFGRQRWRDMASFVGLNGILLAGKGS